jgi:phosphoenolpyruvate carboxykinase (GTP)
MGSETAAAATGKTGVVRRDPFAMLPFAGYNMSEYFQHWLNIGESLTATNATLPKFYCVNWFRKNDDGKFVWPGYGENMRVLAWIIGRIEGGAKANENIFGYSPSFTDLNWNGIDFTEAQFNQVISVDKQSWQEELKLHEELFNQLSYNLPEILRTTKAKLEESLN